MADFFDALNALEEVNKHIDDVSPDTNGQTDAAYGDGGVEPVRKRLRTDESQVSSTTIEPRIIAPVSVQFEQDDVPKLVIQPSALIRGAILAATRSTSQAPQDIGEEQLDEELGVAETYSDYIPAKLNIGYRHPDPIVESASLASVEVPDVWYDLKIPQTVIQKRYLSGLQLEAIIYSCQRHEKLLPNGQRAGFLIGDGAGVGKGRSIAGIIYENYLQGRKRAVWFSVSNDLKYDAERDLRDISADRVKVHLLSKLKYAKISSSNNGKVKKGVLFSTYLSLIGESQRPSSQYGTRLKQILEWCGPDFDGLLIFDECHRAKNLIPSGSQKPTKTAMTVIQLQEALPNARIVYSSATGAVEPRHLAYMTRLGIWGPGTTFPTFMDFLGAVEKRGVGAMEIVAMDMKLRGMYLARQLSFRGVTFKVDEVKLNPPFVSLYNACVKLWSDTHACFEEALNLLKIQKQNDQRAWSLFWSAHQRFFKHLCLSAKVEACANLAKQAVDSGKCAIIGLQSTGEARILEAVEDAADADGYLEDFVSTATGVYQNLVEKHFPGLTYQKASEVLLKEALEGVATQRKVVLPDWVTRGSLTTPPREKEPPAPPPQQPSSTTPQHPSDFVFPSSTHSSEFPESLDDAIDEDNDDNPFALNMFNDDDDADDPWIRRVRTSAKSQKHVDQANNNVVSNNNNNKESPQLEEQIKVPILSNQSVDKTTSSTSMFGNRKGRRNQRNAKPWMRKRRAAVYEDSSNLKGNGDSSDEDSSGDGSGDDGNEAAVVDPDDEFVEEAESEEESEEEDQDHDQESNSELLGALKGSGNIAADTLAKLNRMRADLLKRFQEISEKLPPNALDRLVNLLGGTKHVAEMTGRRGRIVSDSPAIPSGTVTVSHHEQHGTIRYEVRGSDEDMPLEVLNLVEKQRFMDGTKLIAIISEAASVGISLQADRRAANQRRRVHITLELPWSADKAVQQFGRSHRSNQTSAPEYVLLISELAGEQRFASGVARRLESLGALTHGDRRVADSTQDLSQFNFDNRYGRTALDRLIKAVAGIDASPIPPPPVFFPPNAFFLNARRAFVDVGLLIEPPSTQQSSQHAHLLAPAILERDHMNVSRFLNRLLAVDVKLQNAVFAYFGDILKLVINEARRSGAWDTGILDLNTGRDDVHLVEERSFFAQNATNELQEYSVTLYTVVAERGMSWEAVLSISRTLTGPHDGFYLASNQRAAHVLPVLIEAVLPNAALSATSAAEAGLQMYRIYRPNLGLQSRREPLNDLRQRYRKVTTDEARSYWETQYSLCATQCIHKFARGYCPAQPQTGQEACEIGLRQRRYYVLSGAVLSVWSAIETALARVAPNVRLQIVRTRLSDGRRIVGCLIPPLAVSEFIEALQSEAALQDEDLIDTDII